MRFIPIVTVAAVMAAAAGPLAAQQTYDQNAPVTLEGVTETVVWSMSEGKLLLKPNTGSETWEIAIPNSKTLLEKGLSAEVLARGAPVKVRAYKSTDPACKPNCKAQAVELTLSNQGKTYALLGAGSSS
jgi:hypothetical protein